MRAGGAPGGRRRIVELLRNQTSEREVPASLTWSNGRRAPLLTPPGRRSWGSVLKVSIVVADLVTIAVAMGLAFRLRLLLPGHDASAAESRHLALGALALPIWCGVFSHYRLYQANHVKGRREEMGRLVHAVAASVAAMALVGFMAKVYVARGWLALTFAVAVVMLAIEREVVRRVLTELHRRRLLLRRVLIVGASNDGVALCTTLRADPSLGYEVVGFVDDGPPASFPFDHPPIVGSVDRTLEAVRASGAQGVILVTTAVGMAAANRLARELPDAGVRVELVSALRDISIERLGLRSLGRFPVIHLEGVHRQGWRAVAKRTFDVAAAGMGLVAFAPVMVVAALGIKVSSRGPVLFRQKRLGLDGRAFEIVKFRTMVVDADKELSQLRKRNEAEGPLFKMRHDPRVIWVGRFLRRLSIDELPQLWNVLRGQMAIVGPRPAIPDEVSGWSPELHQRLRVKPGITGMWQVCGRSQTSFDDYVRLDLYYVDNWSLLTDVAIVAKTIPAVLGRRGAF